MGTLFSAENQQQFQLQNMFSYGRTTTNAAVAHHKNILVFPSRTQTPFRRLLYYCIYAAVCVTAWKGKAIFKHKMVWGLALGVFEANLFSFPPFSWRKKAAAFKAVWETKQSRASSLKLDMDWLRTTNNNWWVHLVSESDKYWILLKKIKLNKESSKVVIYEYSEF